MKSTIFTLLFLVISPCLIQIHAHVNLISPVGGEYFHTGEMVTIEWELLVPHDQNNWDIFLSLDGGTSWEALAEDITVEQTTYSWLVGEAVSEQARIKIVQDNAGANYNDISGDFYLNTDVPTSLESSVNASSNLELAVYPNPFAGNLNFSFTLERSSFVSIGIFDMQGRAVAHIIADQLSAGKHSLLWQAQPTAETLIYRFQVNKEIRTGIVVKN